MENQETENKKRSKKNQCVQDIGKDLKEMKPNNEVTNEEIANKSSSDESDKPKAPVMPKKKLIFVMDEMSVRKFDAFLAGVSQANRGGYADYRGAYNNLVILIKRSLTQRLI